MAQPCQMSAARILVLGATGCVGRDVVQRLQAYPDIELTLAAPRTDRLERLLEQCPRSSRIEAIDLEATDGLARLPAPDVVVNCAGRFREFGMPVARWAAQQGIDLVDIADEPVYLDRVSELAPAATETKARLIIGSGCAPQCTGALVRLALERLTPPYDVTVAACFGVNRIGPNAARTATEAVGGWISTTTSGPEWKKGARIDFGDPFGRMVVRHYPLPETVLLPRTKGVERWFAGACLSSAPSNTIAAGLKAMLLARRPRRSILMEVWCRITAATETFLARHGAGQPGIAFFVDVRSRTGGAVARLYHPDMTALTADAVVLTMEQLLGDPDRGAGIHFGHEVISPASFLQALAERGAIWSIDGEPAANTRSGGN